MDSKKVLAYLEAFRRYSTARDKFSEMAKANQEARIAMEENIRMTKKEMPDAMRMFGFDEMRAEVTAARSAYVEAEAIYQNLSFGERLGLAKIYHETIF